MRAPRSRASLEAVRVRGKIGAAGLTGNSMLLAAVFGATGNLLWAVLLIVVLKFSGLFLSFSLFGGVMLTASFGLMLLLDPRDRARGWGLLGGAGIGLLCQELFVLAYVLPN